MSDSQIQRGQEWLIELLRLAGMPSNVKAEVIEESYWLTIDETNLTPEALSILTSSASASSGWEAPQIQGAVIDGIQYLANTILNIGQNPEAQATYTIEVNGYRVRRLEKLQAIAQEAAEQVLQSDREFEIVSLSSAERRQVHTLLKEYTDIETYSRGLEPDRRLVVKRR